MINHLLKYYHLQNNFKSASKGQKDKLSMACRKVPLKHEWKSFALICTNPFNARKPGMLWLMIWDLSKDSDQTVQSDQSLCWKCGCHVIHFKKTKNQSLNESIKRNQFFTILVWWLTNMHWGYIFLIFIFFFVLGSSLLLDGPLLECKKCLDQY